MVEKVGDTMGRGRGDGGTQLLNGYPLPNGCMERKQ